MNILRAAQKNGEKTENLFFCVQRDNRADNRDNLCSHICLHSPWVKRYVIGKANTSKILFNEWKLGEKEEELTVMRVTVKGKNKNGELEEVVYNLYDEYNSETNTASMSRTTGYTATAAANMFLDGLFKEKGIFPPRKEKFVDETPEELKKDLEESPDKTWIYNALARNYLTILNDYEKSYENYKKNN